MPAALIMVRYDFAVSIVFASFCVALSAYAGQAEPPERTLYVFEHSAMAARFTIAIPATTHDRAGLERIADEAFAAIDDLESRISTWRQDSQISHVNAQAANKPVRVASDVFRLLVCAHQAAQDTQGAFDITVKPLLELWGLYAPQAAVPSPAELAAARACVGMEHVHLDERAMTVRFDRIGVALDLGGIGKGAALDAAAEVLKKYGIENARIEGGTSSIVALGSPPGQARGWPVRLADPSNNTEDLGTVYLRDRALSTSMLDARTVTAGGAERAHIVDPRTGQPAAGTAAATVLAGSGALSDALSTAFAVLGADGACAYCEDHAEVSAVVVPAMEQGKMPAVWCNVDSTTMETHHE